MTCYRSVKFKVMWYCLSTVKMVGSRRRHHTANVSCTRGSGAIPMEYKYKQCQSLFGYSLEVHLRCKGVCQLCGCGGEPYDFDLWRQLTVEHLIGKSQGGYLKKIKKEIDGRFTELSIEERDNLSQSIDSINTVTACQFCNSTTSRDTSHVSMFDLINDKTYNSLEELIANIDRTCREILKTKRKTVQWKLESVKNGFNKEFINRLEKCS